MSTVGRMGWTFALMKVLTRSRGTPAAAFAMYCSRNVLVDTDQSIVQAKRQKTKRFLPSGPASWCYSPGNFGRGPGPTHTFLEIVPGTLASIVPTGAPEAPQR